MTSALEPRAVQLLKEMGIDVWRLRRPAGGEPLPAASPAPGPAGTHVEPTSEVAGAPLATSPPERKPATVAPFTVLCLAREGALLLIEPADPRPARRFAADLLAAVTGVWGGETRQLVFEWPQPGIEPAAEAVARALGAFVGKQLADNAGARVLVGGEVAARLAPGTLPDDCLVLAPIDALMTDGSLKRALWQEVCRSR